MATGVTLDRARLLVVVTAELKDGVLATDHGLVSETSALAMVDAADAATTDLHRGRLALFLTSGPEGARRTRKLYLYPDAHELAYARELAAAEQVSTAVPFDPGTGPVPGYVAGTCGHRVAESEWRVGFRTCERCPEDPDPS